MVRNCFALSDPFSSRSLIVHLLVYKHGFDGHTWRKRPAPIRDKSAQRIQNAGATCHPACVIKRLKRPKRRGSLSKFGVSLGSSVGSPRFRRLPHEAMPKKPNGGRKGVQRSLLKYRSPPKLKTPKSRVQAGPEAGSPWHVQFMG